MAKFLHRDTASPAPPPGVADADAAVRPGGPLQYPSMKSWTPTPQAAWLHGSGGAGVGVGVPTRHVRSKAGGIAAAFRAAEAAGATRPETPVEEGDRAAGFTPAPPFKTFFHQGKKYRTGGRAGRAAPQRYRRHPRRVASPGASSGDEGLPYYVPRSRGGTPVPGSRPGSRLGGGRIDNGVSSAEAVRAVYQSMLQGLSEERSCWESTALTAERILQEVRMMVSDGEDDADAPPHRLLTATAAGIMRSIVHIFGRYEPMVTSLLDVIFGSVFAGYRGTDAPDGPTPTEAMIDLPLFSEAHHVQEQKLKQTTARCDRILKTQRTYGHVMAGTIARWQGFSLSLLLRAWRGYNRMRTRNARNAIIWRARMRTHTAKWLAFMRWKKYVVDSSHRRYVGLAYANHQTLQEELVQEKARATQKESEVDKLKANKATHSRKNEALMALYATERAENARVKARVRELEGEAVSLADLAATTIAEVNALLNERVGPRPDVEGLVAPVLDTFALQAAAAATRASVVSARRSVASQATSKQSIASYESGGARRVAGDGGELAMCFLSNQAGLLAFFASFLTAACPELPAVAPERVVHELRSFRHVFVLAGRVLQTQTTREDDPESGRGSSILAIHPDAYRTDRERAKAFLGMYAQLGGGEDLSLDDLVEASDAALLQVLGDVFFRYSLLPGPYGGCGVASRRRVTALGDPDDPAARVELLTARRVALLQSIKAALSWQQTGAAVVTATKTLLNRAVSKQKRGGIALDPSTFRVLFAELPFTVHNIPPVSEMPAAAESWEALFMAERVVLNRVYDAYRFEALHVGRGEWNDVCRELKFVTGDDPGPASPGAAAATAATLTSGRDAAMGRGKVTPQAVDAIFAALLDGRPEAQGSLSFELFVIGLIVVGCVAFQTDRTSHRGKFGHVLSRLQVVTKQLDLAQFRAVTSDGRVQDVIKNSRPQLKKLFRAYALSDDASTIGIDDAVRYLSDIGVSGTPEVSVRTLVHAAVHASAPPHQPGVDYAYPSTPVSFRHFSHVVLFGMLCQVGNALTPPHQRLQAFITQQAGALSG
eukprot:TRINITY_DN7729_c0_g1_i1.p1 TRINITY_DN7729_c0_g1~~TRINITY_DN7729_c0_g1_i1.p1  ORF type:complete len:1072 (+),score=243.53 TRINITY_DN7729_c0_g1_i1:43-3216(+)